MAGQRRREPGGDRGGRLSGLGSLALALSLLLMLLPACGRGGPTGTDRLRGDGVSGEQDAADLLVGTWRTVVVVEVPGDLQTWTTVWRFDAGGSCRLTTERESLAEGFPRVTEQPCTYVVGDVEITVTFVGGEIRNMEYDFADFSPDRLVLEGFEYERVS
jgi:hypothetical protein